MSSFSDLGVPAKLVDVLRRAGVTTPFPIQSATIAEALAGRDLCGRAPTGSGKTLAFSLPVAMRARTAKANRPTALILVPTRELAAQVHAVLTPLAEVLGKRVSSFYGGTSLQRDRQRLNRGVDIVVACPGRLADLVQQGVCKLHDVQLVVIDEADRMADMGFLPEVRKLLDATRAQRQTLLFSATLDGDVDVLIRRYQNNPARHELATAAEDQGDVRHLFWRTPTQERVRVTGDLTRAVTSTIVFTRTKHGADRVAKQLARDGVRAVAIHGDRSQSQRTRALKDFTDGRATTLVATDVAARGIHVDAVGLIVHFDPPSTDKDYIHRSGRTGRAGADGIVVTLVAPEKEADVLSLQRALGVPRGLSGVSLDHLRGAVPARIEPERERPPKQARPRGRSSSARRPSRR